MAQMETFEPAPVQLSETVHDCDADGSHAHSMSDELHALCAEATSLAHILCRHLAQDAVFGMPPFGQLVTE